MKRKTTQKKYWEMTTAELAEATKEFDGEIDESRFKPLSPKERAAWDKIMAAPAKSIMLRSKRTVEISIDPKLVDAIDSIAKKKHLTRSELIEQGLRGMIALSA